MQKLPLGRGLRETVSVPGGGDQTPDAAGVPELWLGPVLGIGALLAAVLRLWAGGRAATGLQRPQWLLVLGPPLAASAAVAVGFDRATLACFCGGLGLAARLNNHLGVANQEQGAPVWVCPQLRAPWTAIWPLLRDLG